MKEFQLLKEALNLANQKGCFTLEDSGNIVHCMGVVEAKLNSFEASLGANKTPEDLPVGTKEKPPLKPHK